VRARIVLLAGALAACAHPPGGDARGGSPTPPPRGEPTPTSAVTDSAVIMPVGEAAAARRVAPAATAQASASRDAYAPMAMRAERLGRAASAPLAPRPDPGPRFEREQYDRIDDNPFVAVAASPRSTFSIDVDRASYGNVRRFVTAGQRPPADAVRIEELVNYFPYTLPAPRGDDPLAVVTEVAPRRGAPSTSWCASRSPRAPSPRATCRRRTSSS
jgi:Ca-activated chloride channel family protein